jgi:hypothetical protein
MTMTIVHAFWDDGTVSSYKFDHRRAACSFVTEIHALRYDALGNGNIMCVADGGRPARGRARIKARKLGASKITVREMTRAGPP